MDHTRPQHSNLESKEIAITSLAEVRKRDVHYELLTLREAMRRFRVYQQRIYRWVEEERLHPVKPNGRTLYPAWELEALAAELRTGKCSLTIVGAA